MTFNFVHVAPYPQGGEDKAPKIHKSAFEIPFWVGQRPEGTDRTRDKATPPPPVGEMSIMVYGGWRVFWNKGLALALAVMVTLTYGKLGQMTQRILGWERTWKRTKKKN